MKNVSKLLSILLCLAMVIGIFTMAVGAAGNSTATFTMTSAAVGQDSGTDAPRTITKDHITLGIAAGEGSTPKAYTEHFRIYYRNKLTITPDAGYEIVSIATTSESSRTMNADSEFTNVNTSATTGLGTTDVTIVPTDGTQPVEIVVNKTNNVQFRVTSIVVTYKESSAPIVNVTGVTLDKTTATVEAGLTTNLTATVAPANATNKAVTWSSSNTAVATVSNGKVVALTAGTATITATTADGNKTATCVVTVTAGPTIAATPVDGNSYKLGLAQKNLNKYLWFSGEMDGNFLGTTENFAEAVDVIPVAVEGGFHISFTKDGVTKYIEIYVYSGTNVGVHITDTPTTVHTWDATTKTFFAALADKIRFLGTYNSFDTISSSDTFRITGSNASAADVSQFVAHLYVTPVTGVTLDKTSQNLTAGGTVDLVATVNPADATNKAVTWASSNTAVATVNNAGKVTAVAPGTATITVTTADGSKTATCTITVVAATVPATGVTLDKTTASLAVGAEVTLTATAAPANTTDTITWTSSNASVATVVGGKITAVAPGTATITAKAGDKTATCTVTVTATVSKVELNKETASVVVGGEVELSATVTANPNTNDYKNVTWTTSDATTATVENGKVKALKAGTVTITATSVTDTTKKASCTVTVTAPSTPSGNTAEGKVTSLDKLVTGTYVLVVDTGYAPSALDGSWITAAKPTIADGKVTDAKGAVLTLTVKDGKVTIKDANGKFIAPKGGNSNGITEGEYQWVVTFKDGKFIFAGADADTVYLASNPNGDFENKFRGYKVTTCEKEADENNPLGFPYQFTVYGVNSGNTGSGDSGNTDSGNTDSGNSGSTTPSTPVKPSAPVWTVQDAPKTGVSFKYGLNQKGLEKQLWFTGAMDGYYLAMSEDIKDAVDVVVETVEGGYRLAFTKEGVKKYIDIVERTDKAGSANVVITDEPTAVLTWDATAKTFFAKIGENTFYLGTYNTFKTISASNISYITGDNASKVDVSQYVSHLYLDTASSTGDAFEPMVIVLALAAVSALAVLALNKKKFSF